MKDRDPFPPTSGTFDRAVTAFFAIAMAVLLAVTFWDVATAEAPEPLPELEGAVVVVYSNCGIVTDIKSIDRGGKGHIEEGALLFRDSYENSRALVEFANQADQAWAVRTDTDCEEIPF